MKKTPYYLVAILIQSAAVFIMSRPYFSDMINKFYLDNALQIPLFSGLLTVGAFLLSAKTFIIFKLKDDLYDNAEYIARVKNTSLNKEENHYIGLKQLSDFMSVSIFWSLMGALFNLILGYLKIPFLNIFCLVWSVTALVFLVLAWILVWWNIRDWLDVIKPPTPPPEKSA